MAAELIKHPQKRWHAVYLSVLMISITATLFFILKDNGSAPPWPMDQSFIGTVDLRIYRLDGHWNFHYPQLQNSGGISSSLLVGLYKLIVPLSPETLNWQVRSMAMLGYLVSSDVLIRTFIQQPLARISALLLVATSGFALIQPSSEILAGSLFTLFVVAATRRWPVILASLLLAGFALCKVEFLLAAPFLALLWWWRERRTLKNSWRIPCLVGLWVGLLLAPGFAVHGSRVIAGNRSFAAFSVHYASLFLPHQYQPYSLDPWKSAIAIMNQVFPEAKSIVDVIYRYPKPYLDFLALSAIQSISNIAASLKLMLVPMLTTMVNFKTLGGLRFPILLITVAMVCTLIPGWMFAFVHIRYMAKFYPAIIGLSLAGLQALQSRLQPATLLANLSAILITIIWQTFNFPMIASHSHFL
ncbi:MULTISPECIES: hypothetical protein [unclassified Cyanobium]|uniref:hypothetical protein n=1 Tax=unclassified Cyanobium TaxID=2627006 RepID=UPI0020CDD5D2|nr:MULTISPECIES: hypothetical protein [unclassified Cyanobium]MCP9832891.1 hypothetical protein [Cyanobium sp. La Preciosa 7G6]MCP9935641.1 hypothetical protein [Cyanobium sp. Aljojuca 7A6]